MECIVGQTLQQKLDKQGSLRLTETLRIGQQLACGLTAAHKQGLIHRDIKPANVLLENGIERVKITDFGLARLVDDVSITRTGEVSGTPQYMSPEQAQGDPVDHRSDLFSLGCVLYAMCTGRSPFRATSLAAVIRRVCDDTPRPIEEINPETPQWLIEIVNALLEKNPEDRPQSSEEVAELLAQRLSAIQQPTSADIHESFRPIASPGRLQQPRPLATSGRSDQREAGDQRIGHGLIATGIAALLSLPGVGIASRLGLIDLSRRNWSEEIEKLIVFSVLLLGVAFIVAGLYLRRRLIGLRTIPELIVTFLAVLFWPVTLIILLARAIACRAARRPAHAHGTTSHEHGGQGTLRKIGRIAIWSGVILIALPCLLIAFGFLVGDGDPMQFGFILVLPAAGLGVLTIMIGCITLLVAYSVAQRHPEGDIGNQPWRERAHKTAKSPWSVLGWMIVCGLVLIPGCFITMLAVPYLLRSLSHDNTAVLKVNVKDISTPPTLIDGSPFEQQNSVMPSDDNETNTPPGRPSDYEFEAPRPDDGENGGPSTGQPDPATPPAPPMPVDGDDALTAPDDRSTGNDDGAATTDDGGSTAPRPSEDDLPSGESLGATTFSRTFATFSHTFEMCG